MAESMLMKIRDSIENYAHTISSILEMDVDIADNYLFRLAGTGKFALNIGKFFAVDGNAFKHVLKTKEPLYIEDASQNSICLNCNNLHVCGEQSEICYPIIFNKEVIGVISISSSNEHQKNHMRDHTDTYLNFLEQIAKLISIKVYEYNKHLEESIMQNLLFELMNRISDGIIIFDNDYNIFLLNEKSERLFANNVAQLNYLKKIKQFSLKKTKEDSKNNMEFSVKVRDKQFKIKGKSYNIDIISQDTYHVFVFQNKTLVNPFSFSRNMIDDYTFDNMIGHSSLFNDMKEKSKIFSTTDKDLLIYGEIGTGKELLAKTIHNESINKDKPFISVTCSEANETILENNIFENTETNVSKIELANDGTLFIDEIDKLPIRLQAKLANLLNKNKLNCRLIASTNKNLSELITKNKFQKSLFYALESFMIEIPSLRSRKDDIPTVTNHLLEKISSLEGKQITLDKSIYNAFNTYPWPGNMKELSNVINLIVILNTTNKKIYFDDLPDELKSKFDITTTDNFNIENMEKQLILKALNFYDKSSASKNQIAKELGISKATLYRKLKKYNIKETVIYGNTTGTME